MNKYDPLREFLRRQDCAELDLSFEDVEEIIGRRLVGERAWRVYAACPASRMA